MLLKEVHVEGRPNGWRKGLTVGGKTALALAEVAM
jgi:hypothetical protein